MHTNNDSKDFSPVHLESSQNLPVWLKIFFKHNCLHTPPVMSSTCILDKDQLFHVISCTEPSWCTQQKHTMLFVIIQVTSQFLQHTVKKRYFVFSPIIPFAIEENLWIKFITTGPAIEEVKSMFGRIAFFQELKCSEESKQISFQKLAKSAKIFPNAKITQWIQNYLIVNKKILSCSQRFY